MDRTVKFLLGLIAFSLIALNLQLAGVKLVSEAHAQSPVALAANARIESGLARIAMAVREVSDKCH
jgi:hypothetical protein